MDEYYLQEVRIKKEIGFDKAREIAQKIIKNRRKQFFRMDEETFRFRNVPKNMFIPSSLQTKEMDENTVLVIGKLKVND